jgi:peptide/nickel transport system permease protein
MSELETAVAATSEEVLPTGTGPVAQAAPGHEREFKGKKLGLFFWISVAWLVAIVFSATFADFLPLKDPDATFRGVSRQGPSSEHWFGADNIGHDVFSRTVYGARRSLAIGIIATVAGLTMGGLLGMVSGFYRRTMDTTIVSILNVFLAIPGLVLALALVSFFAPPGRLTASEQTMWVIIALSVLAIPTIARVARAQTMIWTDREFILASRTLGARNLRIMVREVSPNILPAMFSFAFIGVAVFIVVEAALAFFGVGDVSGVSWGIMIQNGRSQLDRAPHMVLFPSMFMFFTILALNFVGDGIRDRLDVREGGI